VNEPEPGVWSRFFSGTAWTVGALAAGSVLFALAFFGAMRLSIRSSEVTVPDLLGLTEDEASRVARPLSLVIEVADRRHDPRVASGRVLQQEPSGGASVRRGRRVKVVLSLGGEILRVPSLVGQGFRAAEIELRRQGFAPVEDARAFSREAEPGMVLAQVPPAGSPAVPGARVHRLVSEGPIADRWVMPDLVGRTREVAERWIDSSGLRRGPVRVVDSAEGRSGTVIGQLPLAGHPLESRGVVELSVAK